VIRGPDPERFATVARQVPGGAGRGAAVRQDAPVPAPRSRGKRRPADCTQVTPCCPARWTTGRLPQVPAAGPAVGDDEHARPEISSAARARSLTRHAATIACVPHSPSPTTRTCGKRRGVASDATFREKREDTRPALQLPRCSQRAAMVRPQCLGDLRCHHPVASTERMLQPLLLHPVTRMMRQMQRKAQRRGGMPLSADLLVSELRSWAAEIRRRRGFTENEWDDCLEAKRWIKRSAALLLRQEAERRDWPGYTPHARILAGLIDQAERPEQGPGPDADEGSRYDALAIASIRRRVDFAFTSKLVRTIMNRNKNGGPGAWKTITGMVP